MLFHSYSFLLAFLPLSLLGNGIFSRKRQLRNLFLLGMSLWFYGANDLFGLLILGGSLLVNYGILQKIRRTSSAKQKKIWWLMGVLANLILLGVFKYADFLFSNVNFLLGSALPQLGLPLPLGISFFTFQQVACLTDAYRGDPCDYRLSEYALFVSFFPYVMSGPIAFHNEVIPQLRAPVAPAVAWDMRARGLVRLCLGLGKKVLLADVLALVVAQGFTHVDGLTTSMALCTMLAYTFQLYFDFSGYCDMASGVGLLLGLELPQNFDSPYRATSISQFWKGWHMTMTRFFTRYVYIPLGGSRQGMARTCCNVLVIFALSGLWHGANWTFVVWGLLHGLAMAGERLWRARVQWRMPAWLGWLLTFSYVNVAWVFFRAPSVGVAVAFLRQLLGGGWSVLPTFFVEPILTTELLALNKFLWIPTATYGAWVLVLLLVLSLGICLCPRNVIRQTGQDFRPTYGLLAGCAVVFVWAVVSLTGVSTFLYVNF